MTKVYRSARVHYCTRTKYICDVGDRQREKCPFSLMQWADFPWLGSIAVISRHANRWKGNLPTSQLVNWSTQVQSSQSPPINSLSGQLQSQTLFSRSADDHLWPVPLRQQHVSNAHAQTHCANIMRACNAQHPDSCMSGAACNIHNAHNCAGFRHFTLSFYAALLFSQLEAK